MTTKLILDKDDIKKLIVENYNADESTIKIRYTPAQQDGIYHQKESLLIEFDVKRKRSE